MCYHERLVFQCGCTSSRVYPCPDREHKERNASWHWVHIHRLTRVCPHYEADQLHIDIECEVCSLFMEEDWQHTRDHRAFADEHAAMHSRLLGTPPKYSIFLQPQWGNLSNSWYMKREQSLKKRVITHRGVGLRRAERFEMLREVAFERDGGEYGFHCRTTAKIHGKLIPLVNWDEPRESSRPMSGDRRWIPGYDGRPGYEVHLKPIPLVSVPMRHFNPPPLPPYRNPFAPPPLVEGLPPLDPRRLVTYNRPLVPPSTGTRGAGSRSDWLGSEARGRAHQHQGHHSGNRPVVPSFNNRLVAKEMNNSSRPQAHSNNALANKPFLRPAMGNAVELRASPASHNPDVWRPSEEAVANGKKIADASEARVLAEREANIAKIRKSMAVISARTQNRSQQQSNNTAGYNYWPRGSVEALESHLREVQQPHATLPFRPIAKDDTSTENVRPMSAGSDASRKRPSDEDEVVANKRVRNDSGQGFIAAHYRKSSDETGSEL